MAKEYFKKLQEQIETLEDGFDIKNIELGLLENEMQDFLKPSVLLSQQAKYLLEMTEELIEYAKSKPGPRVNASKERLLNLLHLHTQLGGVLTYNQTIKLFNRELVTKIQLLRVENADLRRKLDNVHKSDNF